MENPAHIFTTGIPMSKEGNGDHSYYGCGSHTVFKPGAGEDEVCLSSKGETGSIINDITVENGVCFNPSIQDGDQCELLYNIVCGTGLQDDANASVSSPQTSLCEDVTKYSDTNGVFCGRIQSLSSEDVVVESIDEPIGYTLSVPEFKLSKCSEEQKKVNETISAIAKSFGLEDLIPESFQEDNGGDQLFTVTSAAEAIKDKSEADDFDKGAVELHIPDSPMQLTADPDLLESYSQDSVSPLKKKCDEFDNGLLMRVPFVMKDGSTRYVICSKEEFKLFSSCKVQEENDIGSDKVDSPEKPETSGVISDSDVGCILETSELPVEDLDHQEEAANVKNIAVIDAGASDLLTETLRETLSSSVAEPATISVSSDNASRKMQIILTTSQGQQLIEIDTDALGLEALPSLTKVATGEPLKSSQNELRSVNQVLNGDLMSNLDEEDELQCEEDVAEFMKKISSTRGKPKEFLCPVQDCGLVLDKECKLRVHMISHKGARPYKCDVDGCNWAFTTLYRLRRHCETHYGLKNFVCDFEGCNRKFTTVYNLKTHQKRHIWPVTLLCPAEGCEMSFANRRKLELHLKVHDNVEAPYNCAICGKKYYSANCIASHYRTHQYSEDDFKCPFTGCKKKYDKICRLKQHLRHHTGERPYACPAAGCKWSFMSASKLTRHMRKHTGERKFVCSECGKSFMRPEHLKGHVVIHSGDKPFQCPHENCNARFTAKSSLYVHVKKHCASGLKIVYTCPVLPCIKKYNNKATLKQHIQKAHPDVLKEGKTIEVPEQMELTVPVSLTAAENPLQNGSSLKDDGGIASEVIIKEIDSDQKAVLTSMPCFTTCTETVNNTLHITSVDSIAKNGITSNGLKFVLPNSIEMPLSPKLYSSSSETDLSSPKLLLKNSSGSARTDYCCARASDGSKKTWSVAYGRVRPGNNDVKNLESSSTLSSISQNLIQSSSDALLEASSMVFQDASCEQLDQSSFLHDEPSSSGIYQEDAILVNASAFSSELPMSSSLLSDNSDSNSSGAVHDTAGSHFGTSNTVDEFADTIIEYCLG